MSREPRTRRQLVRALVETDDRGAATHVARASSKLCDERAARLLLERFKPLPLDERQRAEATARAARAIASVDRGNVCKAIAHRLQGILDHLAGRPAQAIRELERATRLLNSAGLPLDCGDVQRILIDVHMRAEDYPSARAAARRARGAYRRAGGADARRLGGLEMNVGNIHHRRDDHDRALEAYGKARRHFVRAGEPLHIGVVDFNRANVLTIIDRTREARRLYDRAREIFRKSGVEALVAQADSALAAIDLVEGQLDPCIARLQRSRERVEELGDVLRVAHIDLDAAEAFLRLNRPVDAERTARLADGFFRKAGQLAESAACLGVLGGAALQRGRPAQAARLFGRGRRMQDRLKNPVAASLLEIGQAQAELLSGRPRQAVNLARSAARSLKRRRLDSRHARALVVGAEAALQDGRVRLAGNWATRARDLARRRRDLRVELAALMVLGKVQERRGDSSAAYRHFLAAERCVEKLRRGVTTEESRLTFAVDKSEVYEALVLNRLARGDRKSVRNALVFAERGKARALAERLSAGQVKGLGAGNPKAKRILDRLDRVERELALAESRLEDPTATPGMRGSRTSRLTALTRERMQVLGRLAASDPGRAALLGARLPDPTEGMKSLHHDELVLEYTRAGDQFHLFAISRDHVEAFPDLAPVHRVSDLVELLRFQLSKGVLGEQHAEQFGRFIEATLRGYFERLHDLLLGPVADRLDGRRVRIVPHGILHGLPFHALEHGGRALIDRCEISYAPSLAAIGLLAGRTAAPTSAPLVLGVPDRSAPLIRHEVDAVRRYVDGARVFRGSEATRQALRLSEQGPSLLHVACHGFYCEDGPWTSALRLGDAWLSLTELYSLRGTARLVVLSGCETGRGTVYSGDEWVGLARGFLQAGARSVVASLWEVHDRATVSLMTRFYEGLADGLRVATALAVAQREARRKDSMPLRWAPFVVVGDPDLQIPLRKVA